MTNAPGPCAPGDDHAELHRDAMQALKDAGEAIVIAAGSGNDTLLSWAGQEIAAATMALELRQDIAGLLAMAKEAGWNERGEAMEAAARPVLRLVAN